MLKQTIFYTINVLPDMFNKILFEGDFPDFWKRTCITPIFTERDLNNPADYIPLSLLPIVFKLFGDHGNLYLQNI